MEGREKYNVYREMMDAIPEIEERIRKTITAKGKTCYGLFMSVAEEETRTYFLDMEMGNGTPEGYYRFYNTITLPNLEKWLTA